LEIRYTPENGSNENLMQGLMNRQQAPARLMRVSPCGGAVPHHQADLYVVWGVDGTIDANDAIARRVLQEINRVNHAPAKVVKRKRSRQPPRMSPQA